jgi:hypothetical protein
MPIRSHRTDPRAVAALLLALACGRAAAHDVAADPLPGTPGWRFDGAAAVVLPTATARWPTAAWPGVLTTGIAPRDQTGAPRLEHATLGVAVLLERSIGARLAIGWHDRESAHVESATVIGRVPLGPDRLEARAGRDRVRLGDAIDQAGHYDRFSQTPLALRGVLDDRWIDDGVVLAWRRAAHDGLREAELGAWRGRAFPGAAAGAPVPTVRIRFGWDPFDVQLGAARLRPEGRGAAARSAGSVGHAHGTLDCRETLQQRTCFDGTTDVLAASLRWAPDALPWSVTLAGLSRRERGAFHSASGYASIDSRLDGGWLDLVWRADPRWTVATRLERLVPDHRLAGTGTALLARESGLADAAAVSRATLAVLYALTDTLQLSVEAGHERFEGGSVTFAGVRAVWRSDRSILTGSTD